MSDDAVPPQDASSAQSAFQRARELRAEAARRAGAHVVGADIGADAELAELDMALPLDVTDADQVAAVKNHRDRVGLDRRHDLVTLVGDRTQQGGAKV